MSNPVPVPLTSIHGNRLMIGEQSDGKLWLDSKSISFPCAANMVPGGSTQTLRPDVNGDRITLFDTINGSVFTLPAATGSGHEYEFLVTLAPTSNAHVLQVANSTDFFIGQIQTEDSGVMTGWRAANSGTVATNSDTITLNGSTKGGLVGDRLRVKDVAAGTWSIQIGITASTGTAATPFTAAV